MKLKNGVKKLEVKRKEGYLEKKSKAVFSSWKKKYCIVDETSFICYKGKVNGAVTLRIDFEKIPVVLHAKGKEFTVKLGGEKSFTFRAKNEEVLREWTTLIERFIEMNSFLLKTIPTTPKFWKVI
eukprot:TRINITY_DN12834_c0_g2_i11.p2 TRINITY_DN12834_c0_g2~~TRINITY_DN12834_c0_g2_i11.p2  ORF type:complete len:125 (-),score=26.97 TRINITY_DN12834_c0_g2_i11:816-1190(-)